MLRTPADVLDCLNELRAQLGDETCLEFLAIVQEMLPAQTIELTEAVSSGDTVAAAKAAHKLSGSVGAVGASEINTAIRELEQTLLGRDRDNAAALAKELTVSIEDLLASLSDFRAKSDAT